MVSVAKTLDYTARLRIIKTPQLLELRRRENQRALIERWNGQLPTIETGQNGTMMLQLPRAAQ